MVTENPRVSFGCRRLWLRCVRFVGRLVQISDVDRIGLEEDLCHSVGKWVPELRLVNGVIFRDCWLEGYDEKAVFIKRQDGEVAVLRHAIAWISFGTRENEAAAANTARVCSLRKFLKLLIDRTVEYTTVLSNQPEYLVLSAVKWDSVELVTASDSTHTRHPKLIPLSALCSIGAGSPPPAKRVDK